MLGHRFVSANNDWRSEGSTFLRRVNNAWFALSFLKT
jgi:hypothetical protein